MAAFVAGLRLSDRYVLDRLIATGGMSQVWRAADDVLGRLVAVKLMDGLIAADPAWRSVIRREARAAASIADPRVAQVYDYGEAAMSGETVPYLVMELLDGPDLGRRLASGALPWPEAVGLAVDVAGALAAAHASGVLHGDIKPGNVVLTAAGARVVDFGLAAALPGAGGTVRLARPGEPSATPPAGTPAFLAPEVLAGRPATEASDVYGLGALLYAALTGHAPVRALTWVEAAREHAAGSAPAPLRVAGLPAAVADLCRRCLAAAPGDRPTGHTAAVDLYALATQLPGPAATVPAAPTKRAAPVQGAARPAPTRVAHGARGVARSVPPAAESRLPRRRRRWGPALVTAAAILAAGLFLTAAAAFALGQHGSGASVARPILTEPGEDPTAGEPSATAASATATRPGPTRPAPTRPAASTPAPEPVRTSASGPTAAPGRTAARPQTSTPGGRSDVFAPVRAEISAALRAGTIGADAANDLVAAIAKLPVGDRSLARRVDDLRRDLWRAVDRRDLPRSFVSRIDDLLQQGLRAA